MSIGSSLLEYISKKEILSRNPNWFKNNEYSLAIDLSSTNYEVFELLQVAYKTKDRAYSLEGIDADKVRLHLCWGNYEGPHHCDIPLNKVIDIAFKANVSGISFEAANPRHAHEYIIFDDLKIPDDIVLIPGVVESKSNFIEHSELIAQRIEQIAKRVGRENVIAGTDCGFGTWVGQAAVETEIVWAKLAAMAEGAKIASDRLWH